MKKIRKDLINSIYVELKANDKVTEKELSQVFCVSERTIRRYIKSLKDKNYIELINHGKKKQWKIIDKNFN